MFNYIRGTLTEKNVAEVTIEAAGVGYYIEIPLSTFEALPNPGQEAKLLTHFHVREDTQRLYGFATAVERDTFRRMIGISGVGPKVALNVLSKVPVGELVSAAAAGDASRFKSVPGIGPKTAQRLVMELKDKFKDISPPGASGATGQPAGAGREVRQEACEAMVALGYSERQVNQAFQRVRETLGTDAPIEEWIRKALQVI